jgi:ABC-type Fe3+ transport system permease subunit
MKNKISLETRIMIIVQTILVWVYSLKHEGKRSDGSYNSNGLRLWNPLSWVVIALVFLICFIVQMFSYVVEFIKEFNKNF